MWVWLRTLYKVLHIVQVVKIRKWSSQWLNTYKKLMSCQYIFFKCNLAWRHWNQPCKLSFKIMQHKMSLRIFFNSALFPFLVYDTIDLCKSLQEFSGKTSRHLTKSLSNSWLLCLDGDQYGRCLKCLTVLTWLYYFYALKGEKEKKSAATTI